MKVLEIRYFNNLFTLYFNSIYNNNLGFFIYLNKEMKI